MPDNTLQFETRVDLSGLNSNLSQATSLFQSSGQKMAQALAQADQASRQFTASMKAFGDQAASGNQQAITVISVMKERLDAAKASVDSLRESEDQETESLVRNTSARMAASSELRVLEGNMQGSTRAAGAFLSMLPGLGAAMQAAFPIFGAVALAEVLVDVAGKVHKVYDEYVNLRGLQDATMKLLGDSDEQLARNAQERLSLLRQQQVISAEQTGPRKGRSDRGAAAGAAFDTTEASERQQESQAMMQQLRGQMDSLREQAKPTTAPDVFGNPIVVGMSQAAKQAQQLLDQATIRYNAYADEARTAEQQVTTYTEQESLRRQEAREKSAGNPDADRLKGIQSEFETQNTSRAQIVGHGLTAEQGAAFWSEYLGTFRAGSEQARSVMEQYVRYQTEMHRQLEASTRQAAEPVNDESMIRSQAEIAAAMVKGAQDATRTGDAWKTYNDNLTKAAEIQSTTAANVALANLQVENSAGAVTKLSDLHQQGAIQAQQYAEKISELTNQLKELQAQYNNLPRNQMTGQIQGGGQLSGQMQQVQNQIAQTQGQAQVSQLTNQGNVATQQFVQPFTQAFNSINSNWLEMQNKLIFGTQNIGRAFANMGVSILESQAAWAEQWLAKQAETWIANKILQAVAATAGTAAVAATNVATAESYAAVAGAGAVASQAFIPLVGPILGAAAGASTYAATSAFAALAAFETGGIIPNTGVAMVHQGEAVLPASLTNYLMNTANTNNTSNSSVAVNTSFGGNANSDAQFRRMMNRNATHVARTVQRGMRNTGKA